MIWIHRNLSDQFSTRKPLFDQLMQTRGEVYRQQKNRRTQRICLNGESYFLKQHYGAGWKEIFRNLRELRLPILDARHEWRAIRRLQTIGIATPDIAGFGWRGRNPAARQSFLLTRALPPHMTLEDLIRHPIPPALKKRLIQAVAKTAGTLHRHGVNHRDFYLCHLLIDRRALQAGKHCTDPVIRVIDLHRAGVRAKTPLRWILKDLAGLDFSSRQAGLTQRDRLHFMRAYSAATQQTLPKTFWQKVKKRGDRLFRKHGK